MSNMLNTVIASFLGIICVFVPLFAFINAPSMGVCQEQIDVQMTVLSKDVMPSDHGIPTYSVTFDTPDGAFVYCYNYNSINVYNSVNAGDNCTCTYYSHLVNTFGIKHSTIVKINGVSVE